MAAARCSAQFLRRRFFSRCRSGGCSALLRGRHWNRPCQGACSTRGRRGTTAHNFNFHAVRSLALSNTSRCHYSTHYRATHPGPLGPATAHLTSTASPPHITHFDSRFLLRMSMALRVAAWVPVAWLARVAACGAAGGEHGRVLEVEEGPSARADWVRFVRHVARRRAARPPAVVSSVRMLVRMWFRAFIIIVWIPRVFLHLAPFTEKAINEIKAG